jgi:hypothetical protein
MMLNFRRVTDMLARGGMVQPCMEPLTPRHVALSLRVAARHIPPSAEPFYVLNKVDDRASLRSAEKVVSSLAIEGSRDIIIYAASCGRALEALPAPGHAGV